MIYLDTHVLVRLYLGEVEKLSVAARKAIDQEEISISPAAVLELEFLHEIGRLAPNATKLMSVLEQDLGVHVCELPFRTVTAQAVRENWTRDPFDRLIVANAKANHSPLVTKDEKIRRNFTHTIW